jgi:DNA-binding transcriptional LysR family regulator
MPVDVARLRVLVEVAHAGSIAAAARRMSFTPSALSQQLGKLETEAGSQLLDRGASGIRLTAAGRVLVDHGERILGELRDAEDAMAGVAEPDHVAIGTFATAGAVLVPDALAAFRHRHPAVQLSLVDLEPPDGYGLVTARDLDLLITHRYPGVPSVDPRRLHRRRLLDDPLRLVLPAEHPLASGKKRIRLADLSTEDWISGGPRIPNRVCLETLAETAGFTPRVGYETADYNVVLALVGVGLGIALVPASVLGNAGRHVVVRELAGIRPVREICLVHRRRPPPLLAELIELLHGVTSRQNLR